MCQYTDTPSFYYVDCSYVCDLVEVAGFEPASKQGTNMLSTRLSWPLFSSNGKTQATNHCLICYISFLHRSLQKPALIFPHRLILSASGHWLGAMSRFSTLCRNWANLLYFDYAARATVLLPVIMANPINEWCSYSACLHTCSTCCQNQTPP